MTTHVQEPPGITIPAAAADRVLAAVNAANQAQAQAAALVEAVMLALGAPIGSDLVKLPDGQMAFMPPAPAAPPAPPAAEKAAQK